MDVVKEILDWFSKNSRNLNEAQKKEFHELLKSFGGQLGTETGPTKRDDQRPHFSGADHGGKKYHEKPRKFDNKNVSLQLKIDRVTNTVNKETGYIHGKIDTIKEDYMKQIGTLKKKLGELEKQKNLRDREKKKETVQGIDEVTARLKNLSGIADNKPHSFSSNSNPVPPHGPPPPYEIYPPTMVPNSSMPYYPPPHFLPQFHTASRPPHPPKAPPFPQSYVRPNSSHQIPSFLNQQIRDMNQNVYVFNANPSSAPTNSHVNQGAGHSRPRFDKPFAGGNDEKVHGHYKKKYCDPHWKKFDHKNKDHRLTNENAKTTNEKSQHETGSQHKQFDNSNKGKSYSTNHTKNFADWSKTKRFQQFGKNRPQNPDDGADSDTSISSHVSSKNTHKGSANKNAPTYDFKATSCKTAQAPTGKTDHTNVQKNGNKKGKDNHMTSHPSSVTVQAGAISKTPHPCNSKVSPNKSSSASTSKTESSGLQKLQYPSRAEAVRMGIDIHKRLESPGMCLGKKGDVPVSRPAHCLNDIYKFEMEFGSCQVVRF